MDANPIAPVCLALLTADGSSQDARSGKYSLFGIFGGFNATAFPCTHTRISTYCAITSGYGRHEMTLRVVEVGEAFPPIFDFRFTVEFADPTMVGEYLVDIERIRFPQPGQYCVQLIAAGVVIAERRLKIALIPGAKE